MSQPFGCLLSRCCCFLLFAQSQQLGSLDLRGAHVIRNIDRIGVATLVRVDGHGWRVRRLHVHRLDVRLAARQTLAQRRLDRFDVLHRLLRSVCAQERVNVTL